MASSPRWFEQLAEKRIIKRAKYEAGFFILLYFNTNITNMIELVCSALAGKECPYGKYFYLCELFSRR